MSRRTSSSVVREILEARGATGRLLASFFIVVFAAAVVFLAGCGGAGTDQSSEEQEGNSTQPELAESEATAPEATSPEDQEGTTTAAEPVRVETTVLARGLEAPWGLVFTPDGEAIVSERDSGRLVSVDSSGNVEELQRLPESGGGEGGLLGIALSPDYESDGLIYAYYTTNEDNRVVRFRQGEDPEPIVTGIPVRSFHNGGRIAFGPDDLLYVATGDGGDTSTSQDLNSLGGKILRITPDGGAPEDNPFSDNPVYSYGHRNVEGLAWDAGGQLYASEFGANRFDEVNRIVPGGNYGWPEVEGEGGEPEYIDPISTFTTDEASPSGAEILVNGAIPQWEGDFFMAALRGQRLWRLELGPNGAVVVGDGVAAAVAVAG